MLPFQRTFISSYPKATQDTQLPITTVKPTEDFKLQIQLYLHLKDWFIQTNRLLQALTTQTFQET